MNISGILKKTIVTIPNFPKKGIMFRDITPILHNKKVFNQTIESISKIAIKNKINKIIGIESRGFIFAAPVAYKNKISLILVRKKNKLPRPTFKSKYSLEYGFDSLEIHKDSIKKNDKVMVVDDLIATGGTAMATAKLISKTNKKRIEFVFITELVELNGVSKLKKIGHNINSFCKFTENEKWP